MILLRYFPTTLAESLNGNQKYICFTSILDTKLEVGRQADKK